MFADKQLHEALEWERKELRTHLACLGPWNPSITNGKYTDRQKCMLWGDEAIKRYRKNIVI